MASINDNPYKRLKKALKGAKLSGKEIHEKAIKMTGSFHGKSNKLGQGGRAAQLKAQGVPGGVIGNLARAAHAAPGQKNYHKKKNAKLDLAMKKKDSRKEPTISNADGDIEKKQAPHFKQHRKARKSSEPTIEAGKEGDVEKKACEKCKKAHKGHMKHKHSEKAMSGLEKFVKEEETEKKSKKNPR